jgi:vacuolar-type H+-ATPase catalytic subunit A/Vma1
MHVKDVSSQTRLTVKEKCKVSINDAPASRITNGLAMAPEKCESGDKCDSELKKRLNPSNKNDILRLQRELELWSNDRRRSIEEKNQCSLLQKRDEMKKLLENETKIRRKISSLGKKVMENEKASDLQKYFMSLSCPLWWNLSDGSVIQVETTKSKLLIQIIELYHMLASYEKNSMNERIDLLHKAKSQIQETQTQTSKDLLELLNREIYLLSRNITKGLEGLRRRILHLFVKILDEIQCNY